MAALFFTACRDEHAGESPPASAPPQVSVFVVKPNDLTISSEQPGRMEAYRQAEVRARVPGIVMRRSYEEGQEVAAGAPLFIIDPAPLKAALDAAEAALAEAEASDALAQDKQERFGQLISSSAISARDMREAESQKKQTEAQIASAKAARDIARLKLDYATVTSSISGRARRANVTEGALVGEDSATLLTTVEQIDPIYVNFSKPVADVLALKASVAKGQLQELRDDKIQIELHLGDGSVYEKAGTLLFSDLAVDPETDSVAMRAVFPNQERKLLPGMYVRVKMGHAVQKDAILLPRNSVLRSVDGAQVMVVNDQDEVTAVAIEAKAMNGDQWLVTSGLKGGERVIMENAAMMIPGSKVKVSSSK